MKTDGQRNFLYTKIKKRHKNIYLTEFYMNAAVLKVKYITITN